LILAFRHPSPARTRGGVLQGKFLFNGCDFVLFLGQGHRRGFDRVETGAIVPQDLAPLLVAERQAEKLLDRLGKGAVGMRVVGRNDKVFRSELVDDADGRLLVDVERDIVPVRKLSNRPLIELDMG